MKAKGSSLSSSTCDDEVYRSSGESEGSVNDAVSWIREWV